MAITELPPRPRAATTIRGANPANSSERNAAGGRIRKTDLAARNHSFGGTSPAYCMNADRVKAIWHRVRRFGSGEARQTGRDLSLSRRLCRTFERDLELAEIQGVHLYVQNGVVTLYGTVRHDLDRELLVSLVREIPGVKGVVAHLQLVDSRFQDAADVEPK